ncbi:MAG: hypothetical protein JRI23_23995, partial [Deltaproteobacteria bacterium]|nr:hypothetical protein [Deltaproteobacteria bacterium]
MTRAPKTKAAARSAGSPELERRPTDGSGDGVDPEALLIALVLVPTSYARNRFVDLYRSGGPRQVRRRAAMVRSVLGDLLHGVASEPTEIVELAPAAAGGTQLGYRVAAIQLSRTCVLTSLELDLIRFVVGRALAVPAPANRPWRPAAGLAERLGRCDPRRSEQFAATLSRLL